MLRSHIVEESEARPKRVVPLVRRELGSWCRPVTRVVNLLASFDSGSIAQGSIVAALLCNLTSTPPSHRRRLRFTQFFQLRQACFRRHSLLASYCT